MTNTFTLARFPDELVIPLDHPVSDVLSVTYADAFGHRRTLNANVWRYRVEQGKPVVRQSCGGPWPQGATDIEIEYTPVSEVDTGDDFDPLAGDEPPDE